MPWFSHHVFANISPRGELITYIIGRRAVHRLSLYNMPYDRISHNTRYATAATRFF